jgi:tripartite-type tricarboxylate transporter receptor subunit TctC
MKMLSANKTGNNKMKRYHNLMGACILSALPGTALCAGSTPVLAQQNFYAGKQVTMVVSSAPGGGYDAIARTVARHLRKHIPGEPTIVVQNMGGTGGLVAANHVYNIASRDGLTIAQFQNTVPFEPLYGNKQARYEPPKFNLLGSPSKETALLLVWHTSPIMTLQDAQKRQVILAATGASSTPAFYTRLLVDIFHLKVKLITGYPGQNEQFLAMERGENEGGASTFWSSLKTIRPQWIAENKVRLLLQYGFEPNPELKQVPFALDLLKDKPDDYRLMVVASAALSLGRPFAAPPDVPADRLAILRKAFSETFADPEFLADCTKQGLECDSPSTGEDLQRIVREAYAAPQPIIDRLQKVYASRF